MDLLRGVVMSLFCREVVLLAAVQLFQFHCIKSE